MQPRRPDWRFVPSALTGSIEDTGCATTESEFASCADGEKVRGPLRVVVDMASLDWSFTSHNADGVRPSAGCGLRRKWANVKRLYDRARGIAKKQLAHRGRALVRVGPDDARFFSRGLDQWRWLTRLRVDTVVDVGANIGQFADLALAVLPHATVHSFEPIPSCYAVLAQQYGSLPQVRTYNVALARTAGTADFHVSAHSPSSSLLESTVLQGELFPHTAERAVITVATAPLDSFQSQLTPGRRMLVKLDVEGAELAVIEGAQSVMGDALAVVAEAAFVSVRRGQSTFEDIDRSLAQLGLRFSGVLSQKLRPGDGVPLIGDCLFLSQAARTALGV